MQLPNEFVDDYEKCLHVIFALGTIFQKSQMGFEVALKWAQTSQQQYVPPLDV
jgi:hypothetical protein